MKPVAARCVPVILAALATLACASSALAFSVTSVTVTPRPIANGEPGFGIPILSTNDPSASGAHPALEIVTTFDVTRAGDSTTARDIVEHFAPGIVANPTATAACRRTDFLGAANPGPAANCAPEMQVGTTTTTVQTPGGPVDLPGKLFNVAPAAGEAGALGIDLDLSPLGGPFAGVHSKEIGAVTIDPTDFGLNTTLADLSPQPPVLRTRLRLFGYAGSPAQLRPYFTNPTSCVPAAVTVHAVAHDDETSTNSGSYTPTDCATEPFAGALRVTSGTSTSDTPAEVAVTVSVLDPFVPRVASYVRRTSVTLPQGMYLNPTRPVGIDVCTDGQFARNDRSTAANCPPSSRVAAASFVSPALGEFDGDVFLAPGIPGDTIRLFVDVPLFPDVHVKLVGDVRPDLLTGQVTTVFDDLPQVAFEDFTLDFAGGPHSSLITSTTCGDGQASLTMAAFSGAPDASATTTLRATDCPNLFRPTFGVSLANPAAGRTTTYTLTFNRPDRDHPIDTATFELPPGLVGDLALDGLTQCTLSAARAAACPASSHVGSAQVQVGSGPEPVTLTGEVFLTEAVVAGDPAGLSVVVPAKVGGIDLGQSIIGVRLDLRDDGSLAAITTLPQFQQGVPTSIRTSSITIDRPGFIVTPTSCGDQPYRGTFTAIGGATAQSSFAGRLSGCEQLAFKPRIRATLGTKGKTRVRQHPPFVTTITQARGQANMRSTRVKLPTSMSTNPTALNAACAPADVAAGRCSSHARIAMATAVSPLLSEALTGPVYLVKQPRGLPKVLVQLRGPLSIDVEGVVKINKNGTTTTTFPRVPDLAVSRFTLRFHGGRYGIFSATRNLCTRRSILSTTFVGQNGKRVVSRPRVALKGCVGLMPHRSVGKRRHRKHA
jgi:hypothetical protein